MAGQGAASDGMLTSGERPIAARPGCKLQRPVSPPSIPPHQLQGAVEQADRRNLQTLASGGSNS